MTMKKIIIIILSLIILVMGVQILLPKPKQTILQPQPQPQRKVTLGIWTEGLYDAKKQKLQPEKLLEFEKLIDRKVSIAHYYRGWESFIDPYLITEFEI